MAKAASAVNVQSSEGNEFDRFKEAVKKILTVPKDEVLRREKEQKKQSRKSHHPKA
jgi:hypothetical protein